MTHELKIERLIGGPPEKVFDTFVDPTAQQSLYDDERDPTWTVTSDLDLRPGGTWTIEFGPEGSKLNRETNTFTVVDRPRKLVFESTMELPEGGEALTTTVTVTFSASDDKTLLEIHQTGFEHAADRDGIANGWPSILDALDDLVAADPA